MEIQSMCKVYIWFLHSLFRNFDREFFNQYRLFHRDIMSKNRDQWDAFPVWIKQRNLTKSLFFSNLLFPSCPTQTSSFRLDIENSDTSQDLSKLLYGDKQKKLDSRSNDSIFDFIFNFRKSQSRGVVKFGSVVGQSPKRTKHKSLHQHNTQHQDVYRLKPVKYNQNPQFSMDFRNGGVWKNWKVAHTLNLRRFTLSDPTIPPKFHNLVRIL